MRFFLITLILLHATLASTKKHINEKYKNLENIVNCSQGITRIDYSHNSIYMVTNDTFSDCVALQSIKISYNNIHTVESGSFWLLQDLNYIVLSHNRISYLDQDVFENNKKLRTVILSHNPLVVPPFVSSSLQNLVCNFCKRIDVSEETFASIPNVQIISLVGTDVLPFNVKGLTALQSLQEFNINDNDSKRCFLKHEYPTLVRLQQNNVTLGPDVFCKVNDCIQTNLSLVCRHMYLKTIEPVETNVIMTDYSYNLITRINNESFASQHNIKILKLSRNLIKHIENDALRTLRNLQYIDLSHNKLENIQDSIFSENKNLLTVELSHNSITVPHLQSISLETLVCDFCKRIVVEENKFLTMPNLKSLRALGTDVTPFEESAAKTLPDLREFEVTRNDSRRCFSEKDYPGLLYLQKRGVILGDDVFCKRVTETPVKMTYSPPESINASYRTKQYFTLLFLWFILFIL